MAGADIYDEGIRARSTLGQRSPESLIDGLSNHVLDNSSMQIR